MPNIAIFGGGGKMGCRLTARLRHTKHRLMLVEVSDAGRARIAECGLEVTPQGEATAMADVAILALPDRLLGQVARDIVPQLRSGAMVITLDPAAAHAGELPPRQDVSYFVTHPCHPSVFDLHATEAEHLDYFGGNHARQAIVCALMQGPEEHYALGEELARQFYAPVSRSHRITVEQMAILEPTMAETCSIALIMALREALEEAIRRGVPPAAAEDFLYGHVQIELAIAMGKAGFPFSDGAQLIARYGKQRIFKDDWLSLFDPASVREQVEMIVRGKLP